MAVLDTEKYLDAVCRMLDTGAKEIPVPVQGTSMRPFLGNGDFVFLDAIDSPVKKGDVILFRRCPWRRGLLLQCPASASSPDTAFLHHGRGKANR